VRLAIASMAALFASFFALAKLYGMTPVEAGQRLALDLAGTPEPD
jgi:hypothetical protein